MLLTLLQQAGWPDPAAYFQDLLKAEQLTLVLSSWWAPEFLPLLTRTMSWIYSKDNSRRRKLAFLVVLVLGCINFFAFLLIMTSVAALIVMRNKLRPLLRVLFYEYESTLQLLEAMKRNNGGYACVVVCGCVGVCVSLRVTPRGYGFGFVSCEQSVPAFLPSCFC